jgi:LysR family nitrogen assimilation transcriptional regulator
LHELVLPGAHDGVREQVLATAKRLALPLTVALDISSISMMKRLVANGEAAAVMPYGNVLDEAQRGVITCRRITNPPLRRTMYLVKSVSRPSLKDESAVLELLAMMTRRYIRSLGPLAQELTELTGPALARALSAGTR